MHALVMIVSALLSPLVTLALLLWLAHLEDTLPRDVERSRRRPDPAPITAIPVRRPAPAPASVLIPAQRTAPEPERSGPGAAVAV